MDTLVSLGIIAACGWSVYAMFVLDRGPAAEGVLRQLIHGSGGGIYLEVAASVTTFLLAGRLYEARARRIAGAAMRELAAAGAKDVCVLETDGTERQIPAARLRPGDMFVVRPGETIAADGEVLFGQTAVDRSMMTGESVPAEAAEGDSVVGGTIVLTGRLVVRAVKVGAGHPARPPDQAGRAGPGGEGGHPAAGGPHLRGVRPRRPGVRRAHPGRVAAGGRPGRARGQRRARGADHRVPVRAGPGHPGRAGGGVRARRPARHLHQGLPGAGVVPVGRHGRAGQDRHRHHRPDVAGRRRRPCAGDRAAPSCSATPARWSRRPSTRSPRRSPPPRRRRPARCRRPERFTALPGLGARGVVDGHEVVVGRAALFAERGMHGPAGPGRRVPGLGAGRLHHGAGRLGRRSSAARSRSPTRSSRPPRPPSPNCAALGLHPVLLTGDNEATARAVAAATGIDEVIAGTLPAGKAAVITGPAGPGPLGGHGRGRRQRRSRAGRGRPGAGPRLRHGRRDLRRGPDPAARRPAASSRTRSGSRAARSAPSAATSAWAFGYNLAALPLAALGFLNPIVASAAMTLSSVFVVWNSLRLGRFRVRAAPPGSPAGVPAAGPSRLIRPEAPSY